MDETIWKRMIYHGIDLGDYYLVSNTGEIKGVKTGKIRSKNINHEGYYYVCVSLGSRHNKPNIKVHRAVAETFLNNQQNLPVINHKDGNKLNNNVDNLEFCTYLHNTQHAIENGLVDFSSIDFSYIQKKIVRLSDNLVFDSITDAGLYINELNPEKARKNISRALNHDGIAYGSKWAYI